MARLPQQEELHDSSDPVHNRDRPGRRDLRGGRHPHGRAERASRSNRDDCDPATFNSGPPTGPGLGHICDGDGGTTFGDFIAELQATQRAEKWRFNPDRMSEPRNIVAQNRGGETHSFTKVAKFGGGQVDVLNALSGNPVPAAECVSPSVNATFVPPGQHLNVDGVVGGDKFQCCSHPWMRTTVRK
jgi:hypothetical protein